MAGGTELNHHFKQLTNGAPGEVLAQLGAALLAVDAQRHGKKVDAPALLRKTWLGLAKWLLHNAGMEMNPQQRAFLLTGALCDTITLKNENGERVTIELLPEPVYTGLLAGLDTEAAPFLLDPRRRIAVLAGEEIKPLDLNKPGRYRDPQESAKVRVDPQVFMNRLAQNLRKLEEKRPKLIENTRSFLESMQADRLNQTISGATELAGLADAMLKQKTAPVKLAGMSVPREVEGHPAVQAASRLETKISKDLHNLAVSEQECLRAMRGVSDAAGAVTRLSDNGAAEVSMLDLVEMTPQTTRLVENDYNTVNGVMVQLLNNHPHRTAWSASRILLAEHTEKFDDPLHDCYATPENLARSIAKIDALHPNCFPHDSTGIPQLPPIIIEPGLDVVKWYDDRFIMGFVCVEQPRNGSRISFSPVDLAALQIYGQFLARGDLYNYRGERETGNFVADYAGEMESKAKVKFTGADKKMTIVSASELKDAAGREDAVCDYIDFMFHVHNGLNIPKRITPRRISVILRYCIIDNPQATAELVMKHVVGYNPQTAREIIITLAGKDTGKIVDFFKQAMSNDLQLASRYRKEHMRALQEVMGRDFAGSASAGEPVANASQGNAESSSAEPGAGHDYFDLD